MNSSDHVPHVTKAASASDLGTSWTPGALLYAHKALDGRMSVLAHVTDMPLAMVQVKVRRAKSSRNRADRGALTPGQEESLTRAIEAMPKRAKVTPEREPMAPISDPSERQSKRNLSQVTGLTLQRLEYRIKSRSPKWAHYREDHATPEECEDLGVRSRVAWIEGGDIGPLEEAVTSSEFMEAHGEARIERDASEAAFREIDEKANELAPGGTTEASGEISKVDRLKHDFADKYEQSVAKILEQDEEIRRLEADLEAARAAAMSPAMHDDVLGKYEATLVKMQVLEKEAAQLREERDEQARAITGLIDAHAADYVKLSPGVGGKVAHLKGMPQGCSFRADGVDLLIWPTALDWAGHVVERAGYAVRVPGCAEQVQAMQEALSAVVGETPEVDMLTADFRERLDAKQVQLHEARGERILETKRANAAEKALHAALEQIKRLEDVKAFDHETHDLAAWRIDTLHAELSVADRRVDRAVQHSRRRSARISELNEQIVHLKRAQSA